MIPVAMQGTILAMIVTCSQSLSAGTTISEYSIPSIGNYLEGIASGTDGALWFTSPSKGRIWRITIAGVISEFSVPGSPNQITVGPDGRFGSRVAIFRE